MPPIQATTTERKALGGTGSTEHATFGLNHAGDKVIWNNPSAPVPRKQAFPAPLFETPGQDRGGTAEEEPFFSG